MSQSRMPSYPDRSAGTNVFTPNTRRNIQGGGYYLQNGGSGDVPFVYPEQPPTVFPPPLPPMNPEFSPYQHVTGAGIAPVYCGSSSLSTPYRKLFANQNVEVLIGARGWVVGIIIGVLKAVDAVTNWGYKVEYKSDNETFRKDFPASHVRPDPLDQK